METVQLRGLRLVPPTEAWLQVATIASHEELVQIGEGLVRYNKPLTNLVAIKQFLIRRGSDLPVKRALAAWADMRAGTESIRETEMRRWIVNSGLPEPTVNLTLVSDQGEFLARLDGLIEALMTGVEYDGYPHDSSTARVKDNERRRRLGGW